MLDRGGRERGRRGLLRPPAAQRPDPGRRTSTATDLAEVMALLHRRGVRGYVTLNTWSSRASWPTSKRPSASWPPAGVDAVIVQDLGLARLIRAITPDLEIHASTQMSITSEEGVAAGGRARLLAGDPGAGAVARRDRQDPRPDRAARRGLRPRGPLRRLFRPVPDQRGPRRPLGQPRRVRPGLPHALPDRLRRQGRSTWATPVSL